MRSRRLVLVALAALPFGYAAEPRPDVPWPINGGPGNGRYSPLSDITRENVRRLEALRIEKQSQFMTEDTLLKGLLKLSREDLLKFKADTPEERKMDGYKWDFDNLKRGDAVEVFLSAPAGGPKPQTCCQPPSWMSRSRRNAATCS